MAMVLQVTTFLQQYLYSRPDVKALTKQEDAVRLGIIGASAMINAASIIHPVETHPGAKIVAVASRDIKDAQDTAKKYNVPKAYGSYEELLADPEIEAVYISTPNGLHGEWAIKSLQAGKHVLLEKPFTANGLEARRVFEAADQAGKLCCEAFHWQFHPASHVVKSLISSGKFGDIIRTNARMITPKNTIPASDIRWQWALAGGALMDETYALHSTRYYVGGDPETLLPTGVKPEVVSARSRPYSKDKRVDSASWADLKFTQPNGKTVESSIYVDLDQPNFAYVLPKFWELPSIEIECEKATVYYYNFMMPHIYHYIAITDKITKHTTYQKHYNYGPKWKDTGDTHWSTYRYQLEAFVDKVRGREPKHWITAEDSIAQMETIDAIYEKTGLGPRPVASEVEGQ
ncbi:hypothetical protein I317_01670 [Kwoniella heveanensis CBS 569]|uniref:D-xylose 1-dehydrogenase (NADP(+), D-xylono-1,5-lactone-forming) n=1 Tax=Kwoniella heveanensis BCC8398 TaxID=1296120 RepID=A0A1B9GT41_9TREE|nr:hypothetical protein I316_04133 [Kwoniella heveanensis BCC8398]OCF44410.1 hypothetical protein I317_01670 [Kwoniella heveanensis CBS 569]